MKIISFVDRYDKYTIFEKLFILMPLINCENEAHVSEGVRQLSLLILQAKNPEIKEYLTKYHKVGQQMHAVIKKFGRYPDRNDVLGRENTPKEIKYLRRSDKTKINLDDKDQ